MTFKPGIYPGLTDEEYNAIPAVRSSTLRRFAEATPAHWMHAESQLTPEKKWGPEGRALHIAVLQPEQFSRRVAGRRPIPSALEIGFPDFRTKAAREARDSLQAEIENEVAGFEIVLDPDEMERITAQAEVLSRNPKWRALMERDHESELTIVWEDDATEMLCKARLDLWVPSVGVIGEVKGTAVLATVDSFGREIAKRGYHQQAGWYYTGAQKMLEGIDSTRPFVLAACEKSLPYLCAVRPLDLIALTQGVSDMREALRRFAACRKSDAWPAHDCEENWTIPHYALSDELEFDFSLDSKEQESW